MAACRSLGGFRIVTGVPQGFRQYEAAFVLDPQLPSCNGRHHYSNPKGCHLYFGDDGCWVLNRRYAPQKTMEMCAYMRKAEADKAILLHGVEQWSPAFKRPLVWRWRVADMYYDVTLAFRYEAVVPSTKRRSQPQSQPLEQVARTPSSTTMAVSGATGPANNTRARAGPEAALRTSLYDESMALTCRPTGRACWQDRAPAAAVPSAAVTTHCERRHKSKQHGGRPPPKGRPWQSHRLKAGGLVKARKGRTDGPRGREAILLKRNRRN
jgi:hypothetical protein